MVMTKKTIAELQTDMCDVDRHDNKLIYKQDAM